MILAFRTFASGPALKTRSTRRSGKAWKPRSIHVFDRHPIRLWSAISRAVVVSALPLSSDHALALTAATEYS
jgi:hypothetical protein